MRSLDVLPPLHKREAVILGCLSTVQLGVYIAVADKSPHLKILKHLSFSQLFSHDEEMHVYVYFSCNCNVFPVSCFSMVGLSPSGTRCEICVAEKHGQKQHLDVTDCVAGDEELVAGVCDCGGDGFPHEVCGLELTEKTPLSVH